MLEDLRIPSKIKPCALARKAAELSDEDRRILGEALADPRWSTNALRIALNERGFVIGDTGLRAHRSKDCSCVREA
jgi:hypothetical protein